MIDKIKDVLRHYCEYKEGTCYVLVLLARKKENPDLTERHKLERCSRILFHNNEEMEEAVDTLQKKSLVNPDIKFRLYVSVNKRSLIKAVRELQNKITDISWQLANGNTEAYTTIMKMNSEIKSIYCSKSCRAERLFLWDVDYDNKTIEGKLAFYTLREKILRYTYEKIAIQTKNGYAIVTGPFDYRKALGTLENVDVKTDDYLLVGMFNDDEYWGDR